MRALAVITLIIFLAACGSDDPGQPHVPVRLDDRSPNVGAQPEAVGTVCIDGHAFAWAEAGYAGGLARFPERDETCP